MARDGNGQKETEYLTYLPMEDRAKSLMAQADQEERWLGLGEEARVRGSARDWSQRSAAEVFGALLSEDDNRSRCRRARVEKTAWVDVDDGKNGGRMLKLTGSVKCLWTRMVFGED